MNCFWPIAICGLLVQASLARATPQRNTAPKPEVIADKQARELLHEEKQRLNSKDVRHRVEALQRIRGFQSEEFVKPLLKLLKADEEEVFLAAIDALGSQPFRKSQDALMRLVRHPKYEDNTSIRVAAMQALARAGWGKRGYSMLRELYDDADREVKREIVRAFAAQKEKQAFSFFVDRFDEPVPTNPHSPSNPPASYWKKRYRNWLYIKHDVHEGLAAITGQTFESAAEAKEWAETREARKAGFRYKAGS